MLEGAGGPSGESWRFIRAARVPKLHLRKSDLPIALRRVEA